MKLTETAIRNAKAGQRIQKLFDGGVGCTLKSRPRAASTGGGNTVSRAGHLAARKTMMQEWADNLDKVKAGAQIVPIHQNA